MLGDRRLVKVLHEREVSAEPPQGLKETKKKTNKPSLTRNGLLGQLTDRSVSYAATRHKAVDLHKPSSHETCFYSPRAVPVGAASLRTRTVCPGQLS